MSSEDFVKLMEYIYSKKYRVSNVEAELVPVVTAKVTLKKNSDSVTLKSGEGDFCLFALSFKNSVDGTGRPILLPIKETDSYYEDVKFLSDPNGDKLREAIKKVGSGAFKFDFDPDLALNKLLQGQHTKSDTDVIKLKTTYYEFAASLLLAAKFATDLQGKFGVGSEFKEYAVIIDNVLRKAFLASPNPIQNYTGFRADITFDLEFALRQTTRQIRYLKDVMIMVATRGTVDGDIGIDYVLDTYRRLAEHSYIFLDSLNVFTKKIKGIAVTSVRIDYENLVKEFRSDDQLAKITDCIDPLLRHTESHASIEIQYEKGKTGNVILWDTRGKRATKIKVYTFEQIVEMTNRLRKGLYPALIYEFLIFDLFLKLQVIFSVQYLKLLAALGRK